MRLWDSVVGFPRIGEGFFQSYHGGETGKKSLSLRAVIALLGELAVGPGDLHVKPGVGELVESRV